MTRRQILALCIAVSFFLHMWALDRDWSSADTPGSDDIIMPADFTVAADVPAGNSLALEQASDLGEDERTAESAAKRLRRQAQRQFFKQVRKAVELRKFQSDRDLSGLLGNVLYSFRILPDDTFADIRLRRSSGDPLLDRAARSAIMAASGRVKRLKILQGRLFSLSMTVKYQLNM